MNQKAILDSIKKVREISKKRKFSQSFDLIINLTQLDIKDPTQKVDLFTQLPHPRGKPVKTCALVDSELETKAKIFDKVVTKSEFPTYQKNFKKTKKLAREYDYFIAQANLMGEIAVAFGKALGTIGKMPNPKAGCIVPPVIPDLNPLKDRLNKTARFQTKDQVIVKAMVGIEDMKDEEITENISSAYNSLLHSLPKEINNIKSVFLKLTMGPSVQITDKGPVIHKKEDGTHIREKEEGS